MKARLVAAIRLLIKVIVLMCLFLVFTRWILTCNGTSPLLLIPIEKYADLQNFFGVTCCESAADFDLNLSMLIALPFTAFTFCFGLRGIRFIQSKRNNQSKK